MNFYTFKCPRCGEDEFIIKQENAVLERYTDGCNDKDVNYYDVGCEDMNTDHAINVDAYCANPKCDFHLPVTEDKDIIEWLKSGGYDV